MTTAGVFFPSIKTPMCAERSSSNPNKDSGNQTREHEKTLHQNNHSLQDIALTSAAPESGGNF